MLTDLPRLSDSDREALTDHAVIEGVPAGEPPIDSPAFEQWRDQRIVEIADERAAIARAQETEEASDDIRAFLASVRPLRGCTYDHDDRFHAGRDVIERIALSLEDAGPAPLVEELADAAHFLSNVEPIRKHECYACADGRPGCGENIVLEFIRDAIAEDAAEHVRPLDEVIEKHRAQGAANEPTKAAHTLSPSSDPMDCANDAACFVTQARAVVNALINADEEMDAPHADLLFAARSLLDLAFNRLANARRAKRSEVAA